MTRQPCGTPAGADWHYRHGERLCEPCSRARRESRRAKRLKHGTRNGYVRHVDNGEQPCEPCEVAEWLGRWHGPGARCSTESGAHRHRRLREPVCRPCLAAEARATLERARRRRRRTGTAQVAA